MRVAQQSQPRGLGHQPHDLGGGGVGAAVIDIEDLIGAPPVEGGADLGDQRRDVLGLVAYGDDDGQVHDDGVGRRRRATRAVRLPANRVGQSPHVW